MRIIALIFFTLTFYGCGLDSKNELSLKEVCEASNGICEKIQVDSMCKNLRKNIIVLNYDLKQKPDPLTEYNLLNGLEKYLTCAKNASYIEYIDPNVKFSKQDKGRKKPLNDKEKKDRERYTNSIKKRESDRKGNYYYAKKMINDLNDKIEDSENPYLLYWQWSRLSNEKAIVKLLNMAEDNILNDSNILFYVSQEQIKYNQKLAKTSLLMAMENYPKENYIPKHGKIGKKPDVLTDGDSIHYEVFRTLITLYYKEKDYDSAYVFAKLLDINKDNSANILQVIITLEKQENIIDISELNDKAEYIHDALLKGTFSIQML
jgi:hypothetical protein